MIAYDKNFVYFLGYLWADGFIDRRRTILEIIEEDALMIINNIKDIEFLNIKIMRRHRKNRKPQVSIFFCDCKFYDNFQSKYFIDKSSKAPIDLINAIPDDLRRYFFLGLIDGDGCFYYKHPIRQFIISSTYEQDWSHMEKIFKDLNIVQYEIRKIENKNGNKSSIIRIKKYQEIEKLYKYLYPNGYEIGLKRKFNKCKLIVDNPPLYNSNKSKIDAELLKKYIDDGLDILQISKNLNCNWRKVYRFCKKNNIKYFRGFFKGMSVHKKKEKISKFIPFEDARNIVRSLHLLNQKEWQNYSKNNRPSNIPSDPRKTYKEWVSLMDWIGR